ncbi:MAG: excisionase family DNA-binding protein [Brooklawnia sp.]|uniref:excisionase family DNA-binding protein n=1 Tax=Brooklawnia sp. TaxID=2699740 RepID=UPI003C780557
MAVRRTQLATLDRVPRQYESIQDAARRTGVSEKTIRRRIQDGVLRAYRMGRIIRLDPIQVDEAFARVHSWRDR